MPSDDSGIGSSVKTDLMHFIMFTAYRPSGGYLYAILVSNLCIRTTSIPSTYLPSRALWHSTCRLFLSTCNFYRIMHIPNQSVSNFEKIFCFWMDWCYSLINPWVFEEKIKVSTKESSFLRKKHEILSIEFCDHSVLMTINQNLPNPWVFC